MSPENTLTPEKFLETSADISYRLSGGAFDPRMLLDLILEGAVKTPCSVDILTKAVSVVRAGYGDQRRKMGPLAVLHPLRVAAILSRVTHDPTMMDLLCALLHDRDEDLTEDQWNDYPAWAKRGSWVRKVRVVKPYTVEELGNLPAKHQARSNPGLQVERWEIREVEMPKFGSVQNRTGVLFRGEDPLGQEAP